jgi:hypothetical protein
LDGVKERRAKVKGEEVEEMGDVSESGSGGVFVNVT